jgi:hypothetical protein
MHFLEQSAGCGFKASCAAHDSRFESVGVGVSARAKRGHPFLKVPCKTLIFRSLQNYLISIFCLFNRRLAIRAGRHLCPKPTLLLSFLRLLVKEGRQGISVTLEKRGAIEGPIRIPLYSSSFHLTVLLFPRISTKSLRFRSALFSIPTAPTNISFTDNNLWFFVGPHGAIKAMRLAQGALGEQPCYSPLAEHSERPACKCSWSFEHLHVARVPAAP